MRRTSSSSSTPTTNATTQKKHIYLFNPLGHDRHTHTVATRARRTRTHLHHGAFICLHAIYEREIHFYRVNDTIAPAHACVCIEIGGAQSRGQAHIYDDALSRVRA